MSKVIEGWIVTATGSGEPLNDMFHRTYEDALSARAEEKNPNDYDIHHLSPDDQMFHKVDCVEAWVPYKACIDKYSSFLYANPEIFMKMLKKYFSVNIREADESFGFIVSKADGYANHFSDFALIDETKSLDPFDEYYETE